MFDFNLPSNIIAFPTSYHSRHPRHLLRRISCSAVDEEQIQDVSFSDAKNSLITSLIGIQGRGRSASPAQLKDAENRMLLANLLMQNSAEDAENIMLSANLLMQNSAERPKVLTVEDKLVVLGCKDLDRKIVEAEMEITLAKIQGFLKDQLKQPGVSSGKKLLAVIGVYTGFGSRLNRNVFRGSWMPKGDSLKKLEERGIVIHFVIGRSPNRGDSLDRNIDEDQ